MQWKAENENTHTKESLYEFMSKVADNVKWEDKDGISFSRTLKFEVLGRYYEIIWFHNFCHLLNDEAKKRPLQCDFDTIYTDTCYPCYCNGNDNITFSYRGNTVVRIPLESGFLYKSKCV